MRMRMVFSLLNKGEVLPFFHQPLIGLLCKDALGRVYEDLGMPLFTYSSLKGQSKVVKTGLLYVSHKVTLVFASRSEDMLHGLWAAFCSRQAWSLGNLKLQPYEVAVERLPLISTTMQYVSLSPIALCDPLEERGEAKRFIIPGGTEFKTAFYKAIQTDIDHDVYQLPVVFEPDMTYISKLQEEERKFARIFSLVGPAGQMLEVRGYTLPFQLSAPPFVHETLLNEGIGCARQWGFGMLDVAGENFTMRLDPNQALSASQAKGVQA